MPKNPIRNVPTIESFVGNNSCVACPAHTDTLGPGADSLDACLCVPGYVASDEASEEACAACPRNSFNGDLGDAVCWPCPPHSGTDGPASTLVDCQCHAGYTPAVHQRRCLRMPAQNQIDGQHADTHNIIKLLIGSDVPGVPQVE